MNAKKKLMKFIKDHTSSDEREVLMEDWQRRYGHDKDIDSFDNMSEEQAHQVISIIKAYKKDRLQLEGIYPEDWDNISI